MNVIKLKYDITDYVSSKDAKYIFLAVFVGLCFIFSIGSEINNKNLEINTNINILNFKDLIWEQPYFCNTVPSSYTIYNESFVFCGREPYKDGFISHRLHRQKNFELRLMEHFLTALHQYPDSVVLDVGSNIGPYTLGAHALDHAVISVDPFISNHGILFNSIVLTGGSSRVIQVLNAVSDEYSTYEPVLDNKLNPGGTSLKQVLPMEHNNKEAVRSILFEDILELVPEDAPIALKIDVEGFECKALMKFLESKEKKRFIPYIMIELYNLCAEPSNCPEYPRFIQAFQESGYIPFLPRKVSWQEFRRLDEEFCIPYAFFIHSEAKPVTILDKFKDELLNYCFNAEC